MLIKYLKKKQYEKIKLFIEGRIRLLSDLYYESDVDKFKKRYISQISALDEVLSFIKHEEDSKYI